MTYLQENRERVIIQACIEDNSRFEELKPWWFNDKRATPYAWALWQAKQKGKQVNGKTIEEFIDWGKVRCSEAELKMFLEPMRRPEAVEGIIRWFKTHARMFELYEKTLEDGTIDNIRLKMQKVSEYLKGVADPDEVVYRAVFDLWMEHCGSVKDVEYKRIKRKETTEKMKQAEGSFVKRIKNNE